MLRPCRSRRGKAARSSNCADQQSKTVGGLSDPSTVRAIWASSTAKPLVGRLRHGRRVRPRHAREVLLERMRLGLRRAAVPADDYEISGGGQEEK